MQSDIHPAYGQITATCSCGNTLSVGSTLSHDLNLDICSACHPFYTGQQKVVDTQGRIERFKSRYRQRK